MFNQVLNFNRNRTLNSVLPQMNKPIQSWSVPITLIRISQQLDEGDLKTAEQEITFKGTVQPLSDERLKFYDIGLRSWRWLWIHCVAGSLNLQTGDKIKFEGVRYKVMAVKDYSLYSYCEYELCEDYQENNFTS